MFDISQISTIDIKSLSEDETDSWCRKLFKYPINKIENELNDKNDLLKLFQFTRSLLNVKYIQTDVLIEELQNIEQKYEDIENELNEQQQYKNKNKNKNNNNNNDELIKQLQEKCNDQENQLKNSIEQRKELINELEQKENELIQLRTLISQLNSDTNNNNNDNNNIINNETKYSTDEIKIRLKEKNEQIEQLLDKIYDSDRINLDLAEQLAKIRVDLTKSENECQLLTARREMLEQQIDELGKLNENLLLDRQQRDQEIDRLRKQINNEQKNEHSLESNTSSLFYQQVTKELDKYKALINVKDSEINELREIIKTSPILSNKNSEELEEKNDQIERLEEELNILSENLRRKFQENNEQNNNQEEIFDSSIKLRKQNRKIRNLKKQIESLELKNNELEQEARNKDEILIRQRQRMSMLIGGDERLRKLFEENVVLTRMLRSRENRIEYLINQLNKHNLVPENSVQSDDSSSIISLRQEAEICDNLIAITVERDVLQRHLEAVQTHMESLHKENLELQMGMKEILDGLRQTDVTTDLVIECPSLERVCRLLENRSIYNGGLSENQNGENLTQMILLKSELDYVRGQNEQLRTELKNLRGDFLSVIDEYTTDILNNWSMNGNEKVSHSNETDNVVNSNDINESNDEGDELDDLNVNNNLDDIKNDDDDNDDDDDDDDENEKDNETFETDLKSTEGSSSRPRSRIQRIHSPKYEQQVEQSPKTFSIGTMTSLEIILEKCDIGLDPIFSIELETKNNIIKKTESENKSTQTIEEMIEESKIQNSEIVESQENPIQSSSNVEDNNDDDDDQFVLMTDVQVQTIKINFNSQYVQTIFDYKQQQQQPDECEQCEKHLNMLNSVRRLVEQEQQQYKLQETKHLEMIESLRQNLTLVKKEYKLDIDARNEEIQDLRNKMIKMSNSIQTIQMETKEQKQNSSLIIIKPNNNNNNNKDEEELVAQIARFQPQLQPQQQQQQQQQTNHQTIDIDNNNNQHKQNNNNNNNVILETVVECLQNCLKQKDEALDEYRSMLEQMRQTYLEKTNSSIIDQQKDKCLSFNYKQNDEQKFLSKNNNNNNNEHVNILDMEKIYENLFVKPKVQENDQLMELLRSTLHQLESLRTKSRERIKQLENEVQTKSKLIVELETNLNHATKQLESSKNKIQSLESESKTKEEKIQSLTNKLNDIIRRNQQSIQTATALKKKVENSIFQESADLRSKITELTAELRRIEMEKWNIEKRLTQEKQSARERLNERDQQINQLNEQLSKFQTLIAKMEKKIILNNKKIEKKIETKDQYVQTVMDSQDNPTPIQPDRSVRFRSIEIQREFELPQKSSNKKKIIKPHVNIDDDVEKQKKTKKSIKTKKIINPEFKNFEDFDIKQHEEIDTQFLSYEPSSFPIIDSERNEMNSEDENLAVSIVKDSSRQIVIDPIERDLMSSITNEIAVVDHSVMDDCDQNINLLDQIKKISQRIKKSSSTSSSLTASASSSSSSASSKSTKKSFRMNEIDSNHFETNNKNENQSSYGCHDCESKLQTHRIEQQLIDLRLERLLDQNVGRLKSSLNNSNHIKNKKIKSRQQIHYENHQKDTELDCDQILYQ